ncbi:probable ubiquitin conjugation factor E4 [Zingiber officinale]|uniref:probable ubiquitin conjugation factor E4 n=1 Tax=Zingiber officinale TaxID=94328 RepID=UPI001C4BD222|nr:probable ubiquitin conjugation factor E4 [Zingiber officinale]
MERRGQLWCVGGLHGSVAGNDIGFTSPMSFMEMYGAWAGPPWMRLVDYVSTTIMERRGLIWNVLPICKGRGGMEDVGEGDRGTQIFQRLLWFLLHSGFKIVLKDYTLLGQASTFYKLVIIWLMDFVGGFKMPLPSTCPMKFACIPEHFVDDAMDLLGITFGIPEVSKVVALDFLNFIIMFMTSNAYVKNPYQRAKMVELLNRWIPNKSGLSATLFEGHRLSLDYLVRNLLKVYVAHTLIVREENKMHLNVLNLLINDSMYLLDESLQKNIHQLKEIEVEMTNSA